MLIMPILFSATTVNAAGLIDDTLKEGSTFLSSADGNVTVFDTSDAIGITNDIYGVLTLVGMAIAVGVGMFLGIRFITSTVEEKANIKNELIVYVVGCIVLFGAVGIWRAVASLLNNAL